METFDVAIVGGGPRVRHAPRFAPRRVANASSEREKFPREKVCGDCLNPSCWPVLDRLGLAERVRALPHTKLDYVEFIAIDGQKVVVDLRRSDDSEFAIKRSLS